MFRGLLTVWLLAYPVVSCGPLLIGTAAGGSAGGIAAAGGVLIGTVYLVPWLIGLLVFGLIAALTR